MNLPGSAPVASAPPAPQGRARSFGLTARAWAATALLCLGASAALVYPAMTKYDLFDPGLGGPNGDVGMYVRIYRGVPLAQVARPFRYRIFTPLLARCVPSQPRALLRYFDLNADKLVKYHFGIVNMAGLTACGLLMVLLCQALGLQLLEALLAALLFFTAFPVVNYGGTAMVDTWAHAFLLLGIVAALRGSLVTLAVAGLAGMLAKETTALLVPIVLLLPGTAGAKGGRLAALVPGLAAYAAFRFVLFPGGAGFPGDPATSLENLAWRLRHGPYLLWILFDGGTAFLAVWLFAALGWRQVRRRAADPLARLAWIVPLVLVTPFLIGSNIGRIWFYAFPVMIPLAVIGLRGVLGTAHPAGSRA